MTKVGVIGGSGVYGLNDFVTKSETNVSTPYGTPSDAYKTISFEGVEFIFLPRHGHGHRINPTEINYRANIYGFKKLGVESIVSVSAVGSLKEEYAPGDFVLPNQFIDWTQGVRAKTFFENGLVAHVSMANPVSKELTERIVQSSDGLPVTLHTHAKYICIEGPGFSTRFESGYYKDIGAEIIGMTNIPEAYLAKEAGINYATIGMVTDYDAWKDEHCTVDEIMKVMNKNYATAQILLKKLIPNLVNTPLKRNQDNQSVIVTNKDHWTSEHRSLIDLLLK